MILGSLSITHYLFQTLSLTHTRTQTHTCHSHIHTLAAFLLPAVSAADATGSHTHIQHKPRVQTHHALSHTPPSPIHTLSASVLSSVSAAGTTSSATTCRNFSKIMFPHTYLGNKPTFEKLRSKFG